MLRPRIIPCLLLKDNNLVKTTKFKNPKYVGDPINAVRIFNEKECDELIFLDIECTSKGKTPDLDLIKKLLENAGCLYVMGEESRMLKLQLKFFIMELRKLLSASSALNNPSLISDIDSKKVGNQSVVTVIDVKKNFLVTMKFIRIMEQKNQISN